MRSVAYQVCERARGQVRERGLTEVMLYRHYNYWAISVRQSSAVDTLGNNVGHGADVWEQWYEWFPLQFSCNRWAVEGIKDDGVTLCGSCFIALLP